MITFEVLTAENWQECIRLPLYENEKEMICPNVYSIAEAQFYPKAISKAIYSDTNEMVGYTLFGEDENNPELFYIDRLMISKDHRRRGYAKEAIRLIIEIAQQNKFTQIGSSTELENENMRALFDALGFYTNNELDDGGEIVYFLDL